MTNAYNYLLEAGGIEEEESYPYTGKRGKCKFDPEKVAVRVRNFTNIPVEESQIAVSLVCNGPLAGTKSSISWKCCYVQMHKVETNGDCFIQLEE